MDRHIGHRGRLENSEGFLHNVQHGGWSGVSMIRHNGQYGRLEGSEEGPS